MYLETRDMPEEDQKTLLRSGSMELFLLDNLDPEKCDKIILDEMI